MGDFQFKILLLIRANTWELCIVYSVGMNNNKYVTY